VEQLVQWDQKVHKEKWDTLAQLAQLAQLAPEV
jgi:hypothetical protein